MSRNGVSAEYYRVLQAEMNDTLIIKICLEIIYKKVIHFLIILKTLKIQNAVIAATWVNRRSPSPLPIFIPLKLGPFWWSLQ